MTAMGGCVEDEWRKTAELRPNVALDEYVVMPNHFHGIIVLSDPDKAGTARRAPTMETFSRPVRSSLPTIVRSFKSAVTRSINAMRSTPGQPVWQRNYYEHVIRDALSLNHIREYISSNPLRWPADRENPCGTGTDDFDIWLSTFRAPHSPGCSLSVTGVGSRVTSAEGTGHRLPPE